MLSMSSSEPPRANSPSNTHSVTSSQESMSASSGHSENPSDSPSSGSYNNEHGLSQLDRRHCSVLSHRLGLPLVWAFHGQDPGKLAYLGQKSNYFSSTDCNNNNNKENAYADVLQTAVTTWSTYKTPKEGNLIKILTDDINNDHEIPLKALHEENLEGSDNESEGQFDTVLGPLYIVLDNDDVSTRPLMIVEVGLRGHDWWKKFDQGVEYVKWINCGMNKQQPLLLAIMTIDDQRQGQESNQPFVVKLGVFLCFWKNEDEAIDNVRISLLWHSRTCNLQEGSEAFGRLLRGACDFSSWITKKEDAENESEYEYFSSNCCRVGGKVLRSYDTRFGTTTRSPEIYLSPACAEILGGEVEKLHLPLPSDKSSANDNDADEFGNSSSTRWLQVIVTPYRPGRHYATKPMSFVPVISQLEKLHDHGFVHGDIRAFNTVFDEDNENGYLIDFDFGGKPEEKEYPIGYQELLRDGMRRARNRTNPSKNLILKWHDWYALGRLIFVVHQLVPPKGSWERELSRINRAWERLDQDPTPKMISEWKRISELLRINRAWDSLDQDPTPQMISELKQFLHDAQKAQWTVRPSSAYQDTLDIICGATMPGNEATKNLRATGSPREKKH